MKIVGFSSIVKKSTKLHILKDCCLVVDAQNFFYDCYKDSGLHYELGAECDKYAKYLKQYLSMFKNANVKCYFIFKGGTKALENKIADFQSTHRPPSDNKSICPIFMIDIHLQVLREMEFDYIFSEYESKPDCIAVAHHLSCPVVSQDIEFALSGVQYVPKSSLTPSGDKIMCDLFTIENLLQKYHLCRNKMALFILLTDQNIFPVNTFDNFFKFRRIATEYKFRNISLLHFISKNGEKEILEDIIKKTTLGKDQILEKFEELKKIVRSDVSCGMVSDYLLERKEITDWFEQGVAFQHIAKLFVDVYHSKVLFNFLFKSDDAFTKLSLNIIKYALDLLTAFENDGYQYITVYCDNSSKIIQSIDIKESIKKPICQSDKPVFVDGWNEIHTLGLFQHFIQEEVQFDVNRLDKVPDEAKILLITLIYVFRKQNGGFFTIKMVYGVILCYIVLNVVEGRVDENSNPFIVLDNDAELHSLDVYFDFNISIQSINKNILDPLKEFQNCLLNMNYLNKLCGSPYKETIYSKTYNGTFIYNVIEVMQGDNINMSSKTLLSNAPSIFKYFKQTTKLFEDLVK